MSTTEYLLNAVMLAYVLITKLDTTTLTGPPVGTRRRLGSDLPTLCAHDRARPDSGRSPAPQSVSCSA
jgi:hypothetical protein